MMTWGQIKAQANLSWHRIGLYGLIRELEYQLECRERNSNFDKIAHFKEIDRQYYDWDNEYGEEGET